MQNAEIRDLIASPTEAFQGDRAIVLNELVLEDIISAVLDDRKTSGTACFLQRQSIQGN